MASPRTSRQRIEENAIEIPGDLWKIRPARPTTTRQDAVALTSGNTTANCVTQVIKKVNDGRRAGVAAPPATGNCLNRLADAVTCNYLEFMWAFSVIRRTTGVRTMMPMQKPAIWHSRQSAAFERHPYGLTVLERSHSW
jgi:hypothetical protein